jgi:proteic killer suppression protein
MRPAEQFTKTTTPRGVMADIGVPGFRLHPLKGRESVWEVTVRANRRVIFRFPDHDSFSTLCLHYH